MAIPNAQLETWSHRGTIKGSASTYQSIRAVLEAAGTPFAARTFSIYLQGSYANDTNIYAESDVDIVIELESCFYSNKGTFSAEDREAFDAANTDAGYSLGKFKADVFKALSDEYGDDATKGPKAIRIEANGDRRKADVIVAANYRHYYKYKSEADQSYLEGMAFFNSEGKLIPNFPKQHRANLTKRHQDSGNWVKPMIRVMKNLRSKLVEDGMLDDGVAPSYFIEGLLSNVPYECFDGDYNNATFNVLAWLQDTKDRSEWTCANDHYYLIRENVPNCWPAAQCQAFFDAAIKLWNEWS